MSEIMSTPSYNPAMTMNVGTPAPSEETRVEVVEHEVAPEVERDEPVQSEQAAHNKKTAQNVVMFMKEKGSIRGTFEEIAKNEFVNINQEEQFEADRAKFEARREVGMEGVLFEADHEDQEDEVNEVHEEDSDLAAKIAEEEEQAEEIDAMKALIKPEEEKSLEQQVYELQAQVAAGRAEVEQMKTRMEALEVKNEELANRVVELSAIELEMLQRLKEYLAEKDAKKKLDLADGLVKLMAHAIAYLLNEMINENGELPKQETSHQDEAESDQPGEEIISFLEYVEAQKKKRAARQQGEQPVEEQVQEQGQEPVAQEAAAA